MAKKLCVNVEMFALDQQIFLVDDEHNVKHISTVSTDRVGETLYSLVREKEGVEEIEIVGNQSFIQKIGYDTLEKLEKFYSNGNVRIKLNGKVFN